MRNPFLVSLLALACTSAVAQRGFSGGHVGARFSGRLTSHRGGHHRGWGAYPLGPLYWDSLFSDDSFDSENPSLAPPFIVVQQPAAEQPQAAATPQAPPEPLLIELRGGRYVQISGNDKSNAGEADQLDLNASRTVEISQPSTPLPSTVLVFRDGSRKQITDYTIADGVLYAQANYYREGSWNKPIALSSLNLTATVNENRARGVLFQVPAAPNQVIVGP